MKLTILFNGQFWEGVIETEQQGSLKAARHLFGAEPSDLEVLDFVVSNSALALIEQTRSAVHLGSFDRACAVNPKRRARQAAKAIAERGVSTFAQIAMQQELEQRKQEAKHRSKAEEEAKQIEKRRLMREKAKAKRRGR